MSYTESSNIKKLVKIIIIDDYSILPKIKQISWHWGHE